MHSHRASHDRDWKAVIHKTRISDTEPCLFKCCLLLDSDVKGTVAQNHVCTSCLLLDRDVEGTVAQT